jgi:hypothetical protein
MRGLIQRLLGDRRSGEFRRQEIYNLDYFCKGGCERRYGKKDRRSVPDRRREWCLASPRKPC